MATIGNTNISLAQIYDTLGLTATGCYDLGYVCKNDHGATKIWCKYKPVQLDTVAPPTTLKDAGQLTATSNVTGSYGLVVRAANGMPAANNNLLSFTEGNFTNADAVPMMYCPPNGYTPYRISDWRGYDHACKAPVMSGGNINFGQEMLEAPVYFNPIGRAVDVQNPLPGGDAAILMSDLKPYASLYPAVVYWWTSSANPTAVGVIRGTTTFGNNTTLKTQPCLTLKYGDIASNNTRHLMNDISSDGMPAIICASTTGKTFYPLPCRDGLNMRVFIKCDLTTGITLNGMMGMKAGGWAANSIFTKTPSTALPSFGGGNLQQDEGGSSSSSHPTLNISAGTGFCILCQISNTQPAEGGRSLKVRKDCFKFRAKKVGEVYDLLHVSGSYGLCPATNLYKVKTMSTETNGNYKVTAVETTADSYTLAAGETAKFIFRIDNSNIRTTSGTNDYIFYYEQYTPLTSATTSTIDTDIKVFDAQMDSAAEVPSPCPTVTITR